MTKAELGSDQYLIFKPRDGIPWLRIKAAGPVSYYTELAAVVRRYHRERVGRMIDTRRIYWTLKEQMRKWTLDAAEMRHQTGIFLMEKRWYVDLTTFLPWLEEWYRCCFVAQVPTPQPLPEQWDGSPTALPAGVYSLRAICERMAIQRALPRLKKRANLNDTGIYQSKQYVVEWPNKLVLAELCLR